MHATFVTLWLQVVQPLDNVHETKWTPHVKRGSDAAQSYTLADSEGGLRGLQPPPLNFQKRVFTSVAVVISTVSTCSE